MFTAGICVIYIYSFCTIAEGVGGSKVDVGLHEESSWIDLRCAIPSALVFLVTCAMLD